MTKFIYIIIFILFPMLAIAEEISLFNSQGTPVAYIDTDNDLTIYLWNGKPVAYISSDNIYGFNGKHLGWWVKGIIRDNDGDVIGATKSAFSGYTQFEPYKRYKNYKPYKSYKEYVPYKPYWSTQWSNNSFEIFLLAGID